MDRRKLPLVALFVGIAASLVLGGHYYIAKRLVLEPALAEPWRSLGLLGVAGGFALLVAAPFAERSLPRPRARIVAWPASVWMGFAFLLFATLALSDAVLWLAGSAARAASEGAAPPPAPAGARAAAALALALLAGGAALRSGLAGPRVRRVGLRIARWPRALDGFRVVQLSDIHIGTLLGRSFAADVVERANALEPDLVAVTGDLVDGPVSELADEVAPFAGLRARHGVFFVTGNHDHYSGVARWVEQARGLGWRVLRNERVEIRDGDAGFDLVGVDDHRGSVVYDDGREDLDAALDGRDEERAAVLLAHDPSTFRRARRRGIDLQLSGHTHGGQIWPFHYLVRLAVPWVAGHHRAGRAQLWVSRGTGFWGPPMRLFAPAEITELTLRSGGGEDDRVE